MTELERDREIEGALRQIRTPDHGENFWSGLDAQLGGAVVALRPRRGRWLAVAAGLLVIAASVGVALTANDPSRRSVTADQPSEPTTPPTAVVPAGSGAQTPDGAVRDWIEALGAGDIDRAVELTGPRTARYIESLGGNLPGYLTEAQEGYGAWADAPDLSTTEVELPISSQQITIVVVSGTWTGEGDTGFRTDALPVVRGDDGWLVEPSAFRSDTGGRIELTTLAGDGAQPVDPDGKLSVAAPGAGGFFFSLNDDEAVAVTGQPRDGVSIATWDPPGRMAQQTNLLVVGYVDGETITAVAATFEVKERP